MTPERQVERWLYRRVKTKNGVCVKLAPTVAGLPDRLVLLPGGRVFFVELKAPGGRLRPIQKAMHEILSGLGSPAVVLSSYAEIDDWLEGIDSQSRA